MAACYHIVMRIAVIGPQNTGKSTFIKDFLNKYENYISPDNTYRDVIERESLSINQQGGEYSQRSIMEFMIKGMKEYKSEKNIIFDRSLIDNYIYTKILNMRGIISDDFLRENYTEMLKLIKSVDLYVFIPTHISIGLVEDGVRDIDLEFIDEVNREFISVLFYLIKEFGIDVKVVTGGREQRVEMMQKYLS